MSERNVLLKNVKHPFLVGLHYSFQTADKLYFILDYINGGEVSYWLKRGEKLGYLKTELKMCECVLCQEEGKGQKFIGDFMQRQNQR